MKSNANLRSNLYGECPCKCSMKCNTNPTFTQTSCQSNKDYHQECTTNEISEEEIRHTTTKRNFCISVKTKKIQVLVIPLQKEVAVPNNRLFTVDINMSVAESETSGDSEANSEGVTHKTTLPTSELPVGNAEGEVDGEFSRNTASVMAMIEHSTSVQRLLSTHSHPVTEATTLLTTVYPDGSSSTTPRTTTPASDVPTSISSTYSLRIHGTRASVETSHYYDGYTDSNPTHPSQFQPRTSGVETTYYHDTKTHPTDGTTTFVEDIGSYSGGSTNVLPITTTAGNDDDSTSTHSLKSQSPAGEYGGFTVSNKNTAHTLTTQRITTTLLHTYKEVPSKMDLNTHQTVAAESSSSNSYATDFEYPISFFSIHSKRTTLTHSNPKGAPATHSSSSHTSNRGVATTTISGAVKSTTSSIHTPELQRTTFTESPNTKDRTLLTTSLLFAGTARGTSSKSDFSATPFSFMSSQGTIQSTISSESSYSASISTTFTSTIPENTKLIHHSSAHDQVHENISDEETTTRATNALTTKNIVTPLTTLSLMTSANKKQVDELPLNTSATISTVEALESVLELSDASDRFTNGTEHPESKTTSYSLTVVPIFSTITEFTERNTEFKNETEHPELRTTFHTSATTSTLGTTGKLTKRHFSELFSTTPPKMMGSMLSITEQQTSQPSSQRHTNSTSTSAPSSKAVFLQVTETTLEDELRTEKSTVGSYTSGITSPEITPNTIFSSTLLRIDGTSFSEDHSRLKTLPHGSRDKTSFTTTISTCTETGRETPRRALEECEKPCPNGYVEGPSYCYGILAINLSTTYRKALGFCQASDNSDLARQTDFLNPEVIRITRELSQHMHISTSRFFINERTFRHRGKLRLVDISATDGSTLTINSTVSANEVVRDVAALCRRAKHCSSLSCELSDFAEFGKEKELIIPRDLTIMNIGETIKVRPTRGRRTKSNDNDLKPGAVAYVTEAVVKRESIAYEIQMKILRALKFPGIQRYRRLVRSAMLWELRRVLESQKDSLVFVKKDGRAPDMCKLQKRNCGQNGKCVTTIDQAYCACDEGFGGTHCEISKVHMSFNGQNESSFMSAGTASVIVLTASETFLMIGKALLLIHIPRMEPDPQASYQEIRSTFLMCAGYLFLFLHHPGLLLLDMYKCTLAWYGTTTFYSLALTTYALEAINAYEVMVVEQRNVWSHNIDEKKSWYYGFTVRFILGNSLRSFSY
ncbi:EGF-like domain protein [Necator americanus]|uniref:EGF-like domain protein n=1 Tax=Necator americanus TaxID=51031 RepID=W2T5I7_NECAM|nr:EGF-like domain protein [Necator americanus]ETN76237.1 EGF-like domain protein [Necator americanus]